MFGKNTAPTRVTRRDLHSPSVNQEEHLMLRFFISTVSACALAGTISVFAQEPAPPQAQPQPAPAAATLTGCVQQLKTTDGGTAFVLNNAEGGSAKLYVLIGQASADVASSRESQGRGQRSGAGAEPGARSRGRRGDEQEHRAAADRTGRVGEDGCRELQVGRSGLPASAGRPLALKGSIEVGRHSSVGTSSGNPGNTCPSSGLESTNDRFCRYITSGDGGG